MAKLIDEINLVWNSIQTAEGSTGWNTAAIISSHPNKFRAGRNFPDKCEALLVGFSDNEHLQTEKLPEGLGFHVKQVTFDNDGLTWLALTRSPKGNIDLFSAMVSDVLNAILAVNSADQIPDKRLFLSRIRAWQEFMRKGALPLSAENEVGLVGELILLRRIIEAGVSFETAVISWAGPHDSLRDFELGYGGIEAKTTIAASGMTANIGSLEQLDDANCKPIFLGAVKCVLSESGQTLAELIADFKTLFEMHPIALYEFDNRILAAGYLDTHSHEYHRRFSLRQLAVLEIDENFPKLTHSTVRTGVISARYEINLEPLLNQDVGLINALKKLEMI